MSHAQIASCSKLASVDASQGLFNLFLARLRRTIVVFRAYRERKQFRRHAARLDDHLLRDIGLEREDVVEAPLIVTGYEGLEIEMRRR